MRRQMIYMAVSLFLLGTLALAPQTVRAGDARQRTESTLAAMHRWVGTSDAGQRWREYLGSDRLEAELAKGDDADASILVDVLGQYNSDASGLDRRRFVAVRRALEGWIAELPQSAIDLPALARGAKDDFVPVTEADLEKSKAALAKSAGRLNDYLTSGGEFGTGWKTYLRWDKLQAQLDGDDEADLGTLGEVYGQFRANHQGLELDRFSKVADTLRRYFDLSFAAQTSNADELFSNSLEDLAGELERYAAAPTDEDRWAIGARLGGLESTGQVPYLTSAVRDRFSHPNLLVQVSSDFLSAGMGREVDRTAPVTDNILGTQIAGTGRTIGTVSVQLIPSENNAVLETVLVGEVISNTVGENGPVYIYSDGRTEIVARKRIIINKNGLRSEPARARAVTNSTPHTVSTDKRPMVDRMIRRIAWKKIGKKHSQADYIASQHAEEKLRRSVDEEADVEIAKSNENFMDKFRNPLVRRGEFPQQLRFSTTNENLFVQLLQANAYQLGAPSNPPGIDDGHALSVRVHESMINNVAFALLAGQTVTEEGLRQKVLDVTGEIPEKLQVKEDEDPWSITFDARRPITVAFSGGEFKVTIRGRRFKSGEREFQAMNVTATYKMEKMNGATKLIRQGELEIFPPGFDPENGRLSASQVALRGLLTRRLGEVFEEEIISQERELPGEWAKVGKLRPEEMTADGGWLAIGWSTVRPGRVASR